MVLLFAFGLAIHAWSSRSVRHPPGILAPDEPKQIQVESSRTWEKKAYRISNLATFHMKSRVLHTERYWLDREADLSPIDLAVGWGPMSDQRIVDEISFGQSFRWYHWRYARAPSIPDGEIGSHSANMHMIPADKNAEKLLKTVRVGDVIEVNGYLVRVEAKDGWRWESSLSRTDSGPHSCELVWVERISIGE